MYSGRKRINDNINKNSTKWPTWNEQNIIFRAKSQKQSDVLLELKDILPKCN